MGPMAGRALAFFDQGVLKVHLFSIHESLCVPMATKTYFGLFAFHQRGYIRCVGGVTIHAKGPLTYMAVDLFKIVLRGFVAGETQGSASRPKSERVTRLKALMAGPAPFLSKRLVKRTFDQAYSVRPVRTMARHTVRALDSIPQVGFLCFPVGDGMTGSTKFFSIFLDKSIVIRCVSAVATKAFAFLHRGMSVFLNKASLLGMASKA